MGPRAGPADLPAQPACGPATPSWPPHIPRARRARLEKPPLHLPPRAPPIIPLPKPLSLLPAPSRPDARNCRPPAPSPAVSPGLPSLSLPLPSPPPPLLARPGRALPHARRPWRLALAHPLLARHPSRPGGATPPDWRLGAAPPSRRPGATPPAAASRCGPARPSVPARPHTPPASLTPSPSSPWRPSVALARRRAAVAPPPPGDPAQPPCPPSARGPTRSGPGGSPARRSATSPWRPGLAPLSAAPSPRSSPGRGATRFAGHGGSAPPVLACPAPAQRGPSPARPWCPCVARRVRCSALACARLVHDTSAQPCLYVLAWCTVLWHGSSCP
jgi:hypothetical protein